MTQDEADRSPLLPPVRPRSACPVGAMRAVRQRAAAEHPHLIEPERRQLVCACDPCAILFAGRPAVDLSARAAPDRALADFRLTDAQWDA